MLALIVLMLVVVDILILFIYTASEGAKGNLVAKRVSNRENPVDVEGVSREYEILLLIYCT